MPLLCLSRNEKPLAVPHQIIEAVILSEGGLPNVFSSSGNPSRRILVLLERDNAFDFPRKPRNQKRETCYASLSSLEPCRLRPARDCNRRSLHPHRARLRKSHRAP